MTESENSKEQHSGESLEDLAVVRSPRRKFSVAFLKTLFFGVVIFLIFWAGYLGGIRHERAGGSPAFDIFTDTRLSSEPDESVSLDTFWKVWNLLRDNYVDQEKVNQQQMLYGAIQGVLRSAGDPYTVFMDPEQTKAFGEDLEGSFEGIGAELGIRNEALTVIAPLDDSPAQKSGLRPNDKIFAINGEPSLDISIEEAVSKIRGEKGTSVKLTVLHDGDEKTSDIEIIRDTINVESVKIEFKENNIAYVRISRFGSETDKEFNSALDKFIAQKSAGMVLDLRTNPGGFLDKAVDVAGTILPRGSIVLEQEDREGGRTPLRTFRSPRVRNASIVVLLNEGSASASEILAGALRDDAGVKIIGKKSFGKGSVQDLTKLSDGSSVKITVAKWLTPSGEQIMNNGITPDIEIDLTREDFDQGKDPQLDKALEVLKEEIGV